MKKVKLISLLLSVVMMMGVAVSAADTDYVSSPTEEDTKIVVVENVTFVDENGDELDNSEILVLNDELVKAAYSEKENYTEDVQNILEDLHTDFSDDNMISSIPDIEEVWDKVTGGAPIENAMIADIIYVDFDFQSHPEVKAVAIRVDVSKLGDVNSIIAVLTDVATMNSRIIDIIDNGDGTVTILFSANSALTFIIDEENLPVIDDDDDETDDSTGDETGSGDETQSGGGTQGGEDSPQTGIDDIHYIVIISVAALLVAILCFVLSKKNKTNA